MPRSGGPLDRDPTQSTTPSPVATNDDTSTPTPPATPTPSSIPISENSAISVEKGGAKPVTFWGVLTSKLGGKLPAADKALQDEYWEEVARVRQQLAEDDERARQKQAEENRLKARQAYKQALVDRLKFLANLGVQPIICVANVKSATKSATSIGIGSAIAEYCRNMSLIIPSTANSATVTVGAMSGISGKKITIDTYLEKIKEYGDYRALNHHTPRTHQGLRVIVEDSSSAANEDDANKVLPFVKAIDVSLPNVDVLIFDLGNDNISKRSIALQAARLAHVLVMPFAPDTPITRTTLRSTIAGYISDTGIPEDVWQEMYDPFEHKAATGLNVSVRDKVKNSILVASKTSGPVDFAGYAIPKQSADAEDVAPWAGTGITVPYEPIWERKDADGEPVPFDYSLIGLETEIGYLEIAVAAFEITGHLNKVAIGTPLVANIKESAPAELHVSE